MFELMVVWLKKIHHFCREKKQYHRDPLIDIHRNMHMITSSGQGQWLTSGHVTLT